MYYPVTIFRKDDYGLVTNKAVHYEDDDFCYILNEKIDDGGDSKPLPLRRKYPKTLFDVSPSLKYKGSVGVKYDLVIVPGKRTGSFLDFIKKEKLCVSTRLWDALRTPETIVINHLGSKYQFHVEIMRDAPVLRINHERIFNITPLPIGNFFALREDGISYSTGIPVRGERGNWLKEGRQIIKPSKVLAYIVEHIGIYVEGTADHEKIKKIKQRFIEIKSESMKPFDFSCLKVSSDPDVIYQMPTDHSDTGTLGSSCMRPEADYKCGDNTEVYNTMGAKVVYWERSGHLKARALLWDKAKDEDGNVAPVMDRVYGSERAIDGFKKWAHNNGYGYKETQNSDTYATWVFAGGVKMRDTLRVICTLDEDDGAPYMDTFAEYQDGEISTNGRNFLQCCDGDPWHNEDPDEEVVCCDQCGCDIHRDEAYSFEYTGDWGCMECAVSDIHGDATWRDDCEYVEGHGYVHIEDQDYTRLENGDFVHIDDSFYCYRCEKNHHVNDLRHIDEIDENYCPNCDLDELAEEHGYERNTMGDWIEKETIES